MTTEEIRVLVDRVLKPVLGPYGFDHAEISFADDHDGYPSIFVEAHFGEGAGVTPGAATARASADLFRAFFEGGDERFPYLTYRYADDEVPAE